MHNKKGGSIYKAVDTPALFVLWYLFGGLNIAAPLCIRIRYLYDAEGIIGFSVPVPLGNTTIDNEFYYVKDAEGTVQSIWRADTTLGGGDSPSVNLLTEVARYSYDAWGNTTIMFSSGPMVGGVSIAQLNPIRWKSQYYDHTEQLYYIGGRYYNPRIRQFLSPESPESMLSNAGTINGLYAYALTLDNPVNIAYNGHTIATNAELAFDPPVMTRWERVMRVVGRIAAMVSSFFQTPVGQIAAYMLYAIVALTILATKGWAYFLILIGMTLAGLMIGGTIAGVRAANRGDSFWDGFTDFIQDNWAQSLAITAVIVIAIKGVALAKGGIALAGAAKKGGKTTLANAVKLSEQTAMDRAKVLQGLSKSARPSATSAVVDINSGAVFIGDSKGSISSIHSTLAKQMPSVSKMNWGVSNCAEFVAVNNALHAGAKMKNLVVTTVKVKTLTPFTMCLNCKTSLKNVLLVVSG